MCLIKLQGVFLIQRSWPSRAIITPSVEWLHKGERSFLAVEYWHASRLEFSNRRSSSCQPPLHNGVPHLGSEPARPCRVGSIPTGKDGSAIANEDRPEKACFQSSLPFPGQSHSFNITLLWPPPGSRKSLTYLSTISFLPVCACFKCGGLIN